MVHARWCVPYPLAVRQIADKPARRRSVIVVAWAAAVCVLLWACVVWLPIVFAGRAAAGELGRWFWALDVCASLASQSLAVVVLLGVVLAVLRRWFAAGAVLIAGGVVFVLPLSEPRLAPAQTGAESIRIVIYNAKTSSGQADSKNELLLSAGADIVAVLESPMEFVERYLGHEMLDGYASVWRPKGPWYGCPILVSRHPMREHEQELAEIRHRLWDHLYLLEIVRAPMGDVAVVLMHARSPRRPWRWASGLEQLGEAADIVREIGEVTGLPVVVVGDFNSTPTSVRGRAFADRSGLVRAKPALQPGGTFPSLVPSFAGLAIDGMYASPGVRVARWEPIGSAGSDHRALVVELVLDQPSSGSVE